MGAERPISQDPGQESSPSGRPSMVQYFQRQQERLCQGWVAFPTACLIAIFSGGWGKCKEHPILVAAVKISYQIHPKRDTFHIPFSNARLP